MNSKRLVPSPLRHGDTLGVIAPAGQLQDNELFRSGIAILQEMGFHLKFPRDLWPGTSYLSDSDTRRAEEFNSLWRDPEVKGIIAMRGGYGCLRILDKIDINLIKHTPKPIVGFSDISLLLNYLHLTTGLVSYHGPVVTSLPSATPEAQERLYRSLTGAALAAISTNELEIIQVGPTAQGAIIGGNLASLTTVLGTGFDHIWHNKILFLEDVNEPVYKIDRMLTQLRLAGKFENISGIILGDFHLDAYQDPIEILRYRESIWNLVISICGSPELPIWANLPSGHCPRNLTFPLGATVELNSANKSLIFS